MLSGCSRGPSQPEATPSTRRSQIKTVTSTSTTRATGRRSTTVKREKARQKFEPRFQADPDFRALADAYAEYLARRR